MIKYLIFLIIALSVTPVFAFSSRYTPYFNTYQNPRSTYSSRSNYVNPYRKNYYQSYNDYKLDRLYRQPHCHHCDYHYNNISPSDLNALERYALRRSYSRENELSRLERLESMAFGSIQTGDIATRYRNVENAILSRPQNNYKRSIVSNIADFFGGQVTGFTPSITNFDNFNTYPQGYGNTRVDQYSNGIFGGGWGIQNQGFGNGSRVRILD